LANLLRAGVEMKQILAIDDNADILYTLQAIGEVAKLNVTTVNDGFKALDLMEKNRFDLVMVDYYMPDINGLVLVKKIRERDQDIPILVLTVDESIDLANKFIRAGATDFANKPIKAADLISRVKLHLKLSKSQQTGEINGQQLPKGLTVPTLQLILDYLKDANTPQTIDSISLKTGLAYQTAHRYLNYLVNENFIRVEIKYGKIGRPIHEFFFRK
jgi:two-component system response regulator DctR